MKRIAVVASATMTVVLASAGQAQQPIPSLDFSGYAYGSYNLHLDSAAKATLGGKAPNQFGIDRFYLTFRMPAGDNGQIRVTTDLYQQLLAPANVYYGGWLVRMKYAYFQYAGLRDAFGSGSTLIGRVGLVHDVAIDQTDFPIGGWVKWVDKTAIEKYQFFASSDAGVAGLLILPNKFGEVYGSIVNGTGYIAAERDRFKDFSLRATVYPLAGSATAGPLLKSFQVVAWGYKGFVGSAFEAGGPGQTGPGENGAITSPMPRDRYGAYTQVRTRRFSAGLDWAERTDASEAGLNTAISPRVETDSTGRLLDAYVVLRPVELFDESAHSRVSLFLRHDRLSYNTNPTSTAYASTHPYYASVTVGGAYDVNQRITIALDWQGTTPEGFPPPSGANVRPNPKSSVLFFHWQALF